MKSHIIGLSTSAPSNTSVNYNSVTSGGTGSWGGTEALRAQVVPHAMTLDQLRVIITTAPGTAKSWDYTVMVNGVASALTLNISDAAVTGQDLSHTVSLAARDVISIRSSPNSTPTASGTVYWSIRQDATSLFGVLGVNVASPTTGTNYQAIQNRALQASTAVLGNQIMPTAGTFSNLYVNFRAAPGAGTSLAVTVFKNGVATTMTATVSNTATLATDLTHSLSVVAGDLITYQMVVSGTPTSTNVSFGMSFAPTTDGESFLANNGNGVGPSTSATQFQGMVGPDATWNATETLRFTKLAATTLKALYVETSVSPGVSPKAYTFTVRDNVADTAAAITVNDASTTVGSTRRNQITGQSVAIADDDSIDLKSVPGGSPGSVFAKFTILTYIAPSGGTNWTATPSDSVTTNDAITKSVGKALSDSVATSDANSKAVTSVRADSVTTSDSATTLHGLGVSLSDSVTTSDAVAKTVGKTLADSVTVSEAHGSTATHPLADSVSTSDAISNKPTKNLTDSVTTSDSATKVTGKGVSLTDSVTTSDSVSKAVGAARSDSVTISDAITKSVTKTLSDAVTVSEAHSSKPTKIVADSVATSDAIVKSPKKIIADSSTATDSFARTVTYLRTINDSVAATDGKSATNTKPLADTVTTSDAITKSVGKNLSDSVTTSDARAATVVKNLADSVTTSDVCTPVKPSNTSRSDSVTVTDTITKAVTKGASDSVTTTDSVAKTIVKAIADSVTASDSLLAVRVKSLADSVTVTDAVAKTITKAIADVVVTTDAPARTAKHPLADTVSTSDAISKRFTKNIADSVTTGDHFSSPKTFHDFVVVDDRIRVYKNGLPIVVPTNDWVLRPTIGTRHAVPQVGIGTNAPKLGARYGVPQIGRASNAPAIGKGRISAAPTVGL